MTGAVHIVHDDTERVNAEQSERELLSMLEAVQNELYVFSAESFKFKYVNRSAQHNLGYSLLRLLQMTPLDLKTDYSSQEFMALLTPLLTGEKQLVQFETTHRRADGSCYPVEVNLQLVETRSGRRYLAVVHDITLRKQSEQQLLQALHQAENFRTALDFVNAHIFIKDLKSCYVYANRPTLEQFGCSAEELSGSQDSRFFPSEVVEQLHKIDQRVFNGERTTEELLIKQPDGSDRFYLELKTPFYADLKSGKISGLLGITTDITELKRADEALRELQSKLLQNEKMASIGQLSAGIAHEINNPMGFINSNLGTLEKYVNKFDRYIAMLEPLVQNCCTEQQLQSVQVLRKELKLDYVLRDIRQLLEESSDGAGRVMRIVQDLKTFSRSDTAQIARADLHQCLDSTINIIWNQIKYVAELKKEYGDIPKIPCNIQQINQVFMNLLVNACHAIQEQQTEELGTITVQTRSDNDNAYIAISDTGCGMSEAITRKIFEPFYTTKEVGKGTGLGLSISHEIIKKHGGTLSVASVVGAGSTFTISLPLIQPASNSVPT